ncbi:sugar ABC transporter substrate-binding protein [Mucilaginibacter limnophilus]|uniref:Sugar ABC transporter substrate-binding protein n=1 Tax=Mucilaginibacter limnophilus TaxID=1932778 RepID=A0A437MZ69_9SPHI|nr:substrate-binding domain-containing protein [Mucilaginibacter limnophilus]RVU02916.1 sugar ABC transporter substrate-binding protein [Mucilaginibacter limnophilus]
MNLKRYIQPALLYSVALLPLVFSGCDESRVVDKSQKKESVMVNSDEEYVMVTTAINFPMYVNHDQAAFKRWGNEHGVKTSILGPSDWDVAAQISTIEQVIGSKPAGLLINGTDPGIAQVINKAVDAGIPTVVYDADIPNARYHAFLGTDWYEIGRLQGEAMAKLLNGKGKVAYLGILGMTNMDDGYRGLQDVFKKYPQITIVGRYDDKANVEEAAHITSDLLRAHPDLAGICGFDGMSGPGIGLAIREANKAGKVKVTAVDWEPEHLQMVKAGIIDHLVGQKRELFTWYGAQFLFDMKHKINTLTADDEKAGIVAVPHKVNTGLIEINKDNIDQFLKN